jgi:hypothetical protein
MNIVKIWDYICLTIILCIIIYFIVIQVLVYYGYIELSNNFDPTNGRAKANSEASTNYELAIRDVYTINSAEDQMNDVVVSDHKSENSVEIITPAPVKVNAAQNRGTKTSKGEELVRKVVDRLFPNETIYYNYRDNNILKNPKTGHSLEYDIYIPAQAIAIEYNGSQHYKDSALFGPSSSTIERDNTKAKLSLQNNILLISVPYTMKDEMSIELLIRHRLMANKKGI